MSAARLPIALILAAVACGGRVPGSSGSSAIEAGVSLDAGASHEEAATDGDSGKVDATGRCVASADCPPGVDECETPTCRAGVCMSAAAPRGTACSLGGTRCDGAGTCVGCLAASDCPAGLVCNASYECVSAPCSDGVQDGAETGVDCGGGSCPSCGIGEACTVDTDCASSACDAVLRACVASPCDDGLTDGAETDVDCGGGTCAACDDGRTCAVGSDCLSGVCDAVSTCVASRCSDGSVDGLETDVDCGGGVCPGCALGKGCATNGDCASNGCDPKMHVCITPSCSDGITDGRETAVDCGGGICFGCGQDEGCEVNGDCMSNDCDTSHGICLPTWCSDGVMDDEETDVDCGGGECRGCPLGDKCFAEYDCATRACDAIALVCISDQCADHIEDGEETGVDCGGANACPRCGVGQACIVNADCASGTTCNPGFPHECS